MDQEYTPNSHKYKAEQSAKKEEKKKIERVVQGDVKIKKKSGFSKFVSSFICEEPENIKTYLVSDVIIPTIKDAIIETVKMFLNGGKPSERRGRLNVDRVSYRDYYGRKNYETPRPAASSAKLSYSYDDIYLTSRQEAEDLISHMNDVIDEYDAVTVGDLFDMVGVSSSFTDNKYGWTNISSARVERTSDGFRLDLPKAKPLN